jgi:hypothetical protein
MRTMPPGLDGQAGSPSPTAVTMATIMASTLVGHVRRNAKAGTTCVGSSLGWRWKKCTRQGGRALMGARLLHHALSACMNGSTFTSAFSLSR